MLKSNATKRLAKSYVNEITSKMIDQSLDNFANNIHTIGSGGVIGNNCILLPKSKRRTDIDDLLDIYEQQQGNGFLNNMIN